MFEVNQKISCESVLHCVYMCVNCDVKHPIDEVISVWKFEATCRTAAPSTMIADGANIKFFL